MTAKQLGKFLRHLGEAQIDGIDENCILVTTKDGLKCRVDLPADNKTD